MGKILLATTRRRPGRAAFKYAVHLCRESGAELNILQIKPRKKLSALFRIIFGSGDSHMKKLLRLSEEQGVRCATAIQTGSPEKEIARFIRERRNIIMAVYDKPGSLLSERENERNLAIQLGVPFVTVHNGGLFRKIKAVQQCFTEEKMFRKIKNIFNRTKKTENETTAKIHAPAKEEAYEEESPRLVVVGNESNFSASVVDYAMEMATRMDYQIIALNTAPLSCDTFRLFKNTGSQLCEDFRQVSLNNVTPFEQKAKEQNIHFTHVVKFVETDEALKEIQQEFGEIGFIISEPESQNAAYNRQENENRVSRGLCVYSMR